MRSVQDESTESVGSARKGWLTRDHILTTRPLAAVKKWLASRKKE